MPPYIRTLITSPDRTGAPSRLASAVSGSSTGSVASLAPGAVAHSPVNAIMPEPERGHRDRGQRPGERAGLERADKHAHHGLDAAAGDRRLGQLRRRCGGGILRRW